MARSCRAEVADRILANTEGVPLFVEELTRTVLDSGLLVEAGDRYLAIGPLPALAIPSTLQDSLMARLDRLCAGEGDGADRRLHRPRLPSPAAGRRERRTAETGSTMRCSSWNSPSSSFAAASHRRRPTRSSTRWCATRPTRAC